MRHYIRQLAVQQHRPQFSLVTNLLNRNNQSTLTPTHQNFLALEQTNDRLSSYRQAVGKSLNLRWQTLVKPNLRVQDSEKLGESLQTRYRSQVSKQVPLAPESHVTAKRPMTFARAARPQNPN